MSKRFRFVVATMLAMGGLAIFLVHFFSDPERDGDFQIKETDLAAAVQKHAGSELPPPSAPVPIEPSRSVRLAVGGLGLGSDEQNRRVGDLILAELAGAKGLGLVE